jgi:hypothetical protein
MKKINIKIVLFILLIGNGLHTHLQAQNILIASGYTNHAIQDLGYSPLIYRGHSAYLSISLEKLKTRGEFTAELGITRASLKPKLNESKDFNLNTASRTLVNGYARRLWKKQQNKLTYGSGLVLYSQFDLVNFQHKANNPIGYEMAASINPAFLLSLKVADKIGISSIIDLSLLTYSIRPDAHGLFPTKNLDADMGAVFDNGQLAFSNETFGFHLNTKIDLIIKEKRLAFIYDYRGAKNKTVERKGSTIHQLGIQLPLNIKKQ